MPCHDINVKNATCMAYSQPYNGVNEPNILNIFGCQHKPGVSKSFTCHYYRNAIGIAQYNTSQDKRQYIV